MPHRLEPDAGALWAEAAPLVERGGGVLVLDDSTLDKPYARAMDLVTRHWSGKHRRIVSGITLLTLRWTDGEVLLPCDDRLDAKGTDGLTKHDRFRALLDAAKSRGFAPRAVFFDRWYAGLANLKAVRDHGWRWVTRLKRNRLVNPDGTGNRPLVDCAIGEVDTRVHLQGHGFVRVYMLVASDGDREYRATSDLTLTDVQRLKYAELAWGIGTYHRGIKQHCGVERAQVRAARAQRNHVTCAWNATASPPGSAGGRPRPPSSAPPSAPTWPPRPTPSRQLRNSY